MINEIKNALLRQLEIHDAKYKAEYDKYYEGMCDGIDLSLQEIDKFTDNKNTEPTFDDLIDVATKAVEDGVLFSVGLFEDSIFIYLSHASYHTNRPSFSVSRDDDIAGIPGIIEKINSLYVESFEIEDISCLLKINENIQSLVLANGCDVIDQIYFEDCGMHLKDGYGNSIVPNINILKGATVTQKRGSHD